MKESTYFYVKGLFWGGAGAPLSIFALWVKTVYTPYNCETQKGCNHDW